MKMISFLFAIMMASCSMPTNENVEEQTIKEEASTQNVSVDTIHILLEGVMEAVDPYENGVLSIDGEEGRFTMIGEKNGKIDDVTIYKLKLVSYKETSSKKENGYNEWTGELVLNAIDPHNNSVVGQMKGEFYSSNNSEDINHHAIRMGCGQKGCHQCTYSYNGVFTDFKGATSSFSFQHDNYMLFENEGDYDEEP